MGSDSCDYVNSDHVAQMQADGPEARVSDEAAGYRGSPPAGRRGVTPFRALEIYRNAWRGVGG